MACFQAHKNGVIVQIRLQPRSSKSEIAGVKDDFLKIRVNAPPVAGAANKACRELLAAVFGIAKGRVEILAGARTREKRILLRGLDTESVSSLIEEIRDKSK